MTDRSSGTRVVVLIPAFNEGPRLPAVLAAITALAPRDDGAAATGRSPWELVVVDDGSRDDTGAVARAAGATVLRHPFNLGYGAALQTGYKYALARGAERLVQLDADGQHDPAQIPELLARLDEAGADLVIGSRFLGVGDYRMDGARDLGRRLFQRLAARAGLAVTDPTSGLQAMRRELLELYVNEFFPADYPDVDVLLAAHRRGLKITELPVRMHAGTRASTLHGGLRSFYYVYRLTLALWAGDRRAR